MYDAMDGDSFNGRSLLEFAEYIASMQREICYYKQFIVNISALLREDGIHIPAILVQDVNCDAHSLCDAAWRDLIKYINRKNGEEEN